MSTLYLYPQLGQTGHTQHKPLHNVVSNPKPGVARYEMVCNLPRLPRPAVDPAGSALARATASTKAKAVPLHGGGLVRTNQPRADIKEAIGCPVGITIHYFNQMIAAPNRKNRWGIWCMKPLIGPAVADPASEVTGIYLSNTCVCLGSNCTFCLSQVYPAWRKLSLQMEIHGSLIPVWKNNLYPHPIRVFPVATHVLAVHLRACHEHRVKRVKNTFVLKPSLLICLINGVWNTFRPRQSLFVKAQDISASPQQLNDFKIGAISLPTLQLTAYKCRLGCCGAHDSKRRNVLRRNLLERYLVQCRDYRIPFLSSAITDVSANHPAFFIWNEKAVGQHPQLLIAIFSNKPHLAQDVLLLLFGNVIAMQDGKVYRAYQRQDSAYRLDPCGPSSPRVYRQHEYIGHRKDNYSADYCGVSLNPSYDPFANHDHLPFPTGNKRLPAYLCAVYGEVA